jgi:hypothetical protein
LKTQPATLVMTLMSIGEMLVGVAILALPREVALLLVDAALDARGLLVARMLGVAVLALGITWWMARRDSDRPLRYSPGFIIYNLGVGALFGVAALAAARPALPGFVCVAHVTAAVAFARFIVNNRSTREAT